MRSGVALFLALTCIQAAAVGDDLSGGTPVSQTNLTVLWTAPTNSWPDRLWVYKVAPQEFAGPVISNLLRIASFAMSDRTKVPPAFAEKDKKALFFGELDGHYKHLAICPTLGYVDYYDPKAASDGYFQPPVEVPNQEKTTRLGLKYIRLLGVDVSQLAVKPGTDDLDLHWDRGTVGYLDQKTKTEVNLTNTFGVFFRRRIDGINVGGIALNGGVFLEFGNTGRVRVLQVYWRNLKPYELRDCVSPDQIAEWLRTGRLALPAKAGPPSQITKLTVSFAMPYYDNKFGDEPENFVVPKVDMVATAERPDGPVTFQFQAPMLRQDTKQK